MRQRFTTTSKRSLFTAPAVAAAICLSVIPVFGGSASAAPDQIAQAKSALSDATARRIAGEQRIGDIKTQIQALDTQLAGMNEEDERLTRELADAKDAMQQFAIAAYIDGRKADIASASLDPAKAQALVWQSTLSVGQSASADEVAARYAELKAAVGPRKQEAAQKLEDAQAALVDANNDVIQAAAFERDAEAALANAQEQERRRVAEEKAQARQAAAAAKAQQAADAKAKKSTPPRTNAPAPAPVETPQLSGAKGNPTAAESATLAKIRRCESRGNYSVVSASGRYRGAYQFDYRTWAGMGGSGDPAAASPAEQDYRALLLLRQRGTRPWPVCGR